MFKSLVEKRYSVRSYRKDVPVEEDKLRDIFTCVRLAPSAVNYQPWKFLVLSSDEEKAKVYPHYDREWFREAPIIIICCADHTRSWKRKHDGKDHADIDVAIAVEHLCLAAADLGLGTCWVCNFDAKGISEAFGIPDHIEPVALVPLGYPTSNEVPEKTRKPLEEIIEKRK